MSWLRMDDGTPQHPKLLQLDRADRWTWFEVLCWCGRYRTEGRVTRDITEAVTAASRDFLDRCVELRLFDRSGDGYRVHDWDKYNPTRDPTAKERKRRQRAKQRDASVTVTRDEPVTEPVTERDEPVTVTRDSRGRARARVPVPSPGTSLQDVPEGTGPELDTPPPPAAQEAAPAAESEENSRPPGRPLPVTCPYEYEGGVVCGNEFRDEDALDEHMQRQHLTTLAAYLADLEALP